MRRAISAQRQMLDYDPFLFYREQITCSREDWIARRLVLRAAGFLGRRERNVWRWSNNLSHPRWAVRYFLHLHTHCKASGKLELRSPTALERKARSRRLLSNLAPTDVQYSSTVF
jgi:hypothetical protein